MFVLVAMLACQPGPTGQDQPPERPPVPEEVTAVGARSAPSVAAEQAALDLAASVGGVFVHPQALDYARDGAVDVRSGGSLPCVELSLVNGDLVLAYDQCHGLDGTVRIRFSLFAPTELTFDDDFSVDGKDLDGTVIVDRDGFFDELAVEGVLTYEAREIEVELELDVERGGAELWGLAVVTSPEGFVRVDVGTVTEPLAFEMGCPCPVSGAVALATEHKIDEVEIDLDDLFSVDLTDDYPAVRVPVDPVTSWIEAELDFSGGCAAVSVAVTANDFALVMQRADLEAAVEGACKAGEIDEGACLELEAHLDLAKAEISVLVPLGVAANSAEDALQQMLEPLCGA